MSILVGFHCYDGVLMASDTLYSGAVQSTYGEKMWCLQVQEPSVVFGAVGTVGPIKRARNEIEQNLRPGMSFQETLDAIDDALLKVHKKFPPLEGWAPRVQTLVGIKSEGRSYLYQNVQNEVALSPVEDPHVCLGVDSLGNYFAESLFREGMQLEWAEIVAAYLVGNCKRYAAGYCGGDTHLMIIRNQAGVYPYGKTQQSYMEELESYLSGIGQGMQAVLPGGSPGMSPTTDTLKRRARFIIDAIEKAATDSYDLPHQEIEDDEKSH